MICNQCMSILRNEMSIADFLVMMIITIVCKAQFFFKGPEHCTKNMMGGGGVG